MKGKNESVSLFKNSRGQTDGLIYISERSIDRKPLPVLTLWTGIEELKEIPLWGTPLPPECIPMLYIYAEIETVNFPPFSRISVHLQAVDGSVDYSTPAELINSPEPFKTLFPEEELQRFVGKTVDFSYSVGIGDEGAILSERRRVHIRLPLQSSWPIIEGVTEQGLIVADYPNGLNVSLAPVENLDTYNDITCFWVVQIIENGSLYPLYEWSVTVRPSDKPYRFRVPAEAYTGYPPNAFAGCGVSTNLFPHGYSNYGWGFGGNSNIVLI